MWKIAFTVLLILNMAVVGAFTVWWGRLPKATDVQKRVSQLYSQDKPATLQLSLGEDAINSYLEYAVSEQPELQKVLSYARVQFASDWTIQIGVKLRDRVVPCTIQISPTVSNGDLHLQVQQADMGQIPVPPAALFFVFKHLPWPNWITVDSNNSTLNLLFSQRPQNPYGVEVVNYNANTRQITLNVTIVPKSLLGTKPSSTSN